MDFESTANAAVTKLQEIEEIVNTAQPQFEAAEQHLTEVEQEFQQVADQLLSALDAVEQKIESARSEQQSVADDVLQRLGSLKESAQDLQGRATDELTAIKELSEGLSTAGQEVQEFLQTQLTNVQSGLDEAKSLLETTQQEVSTLVSDMQSGIQDAATALEERAQEISDAGETVQTFLTEEVQNGIQTHLDTVHESFGELQTNLESKLTESRDSVDRAAHDAIDQVTGDYEGQMQEAVAKVESFVDMMTSIAEKATSAGDAMVETKDVMCVAMKSTNVGLESVVDTLRNIKEIFEKIV